MRPKSGESEMSESQKKEDSITQKPIECLNLGSVICFFPILNGNACSPLVLYVCIINKGYVPE